jgi:hypothetical protein
VSPKGLWHFFADGERIAPHLQRIFMQNRPLDPFVIDSLFGAEIRAAVAAGDPLGRYLARAWPDLGIKLS